MSKKVLRFLQLATGIILLSITILIVSILNKNGNESLGQKKIKRQASVKNSTYQELLHAGDTAFYKGRLEAAAEYYQKASQLEPRETLPYEKIGDILFRQKNYIGARHNYELAQSSIKLIRATLGLRKVLEGKTLLEKIQPPTQASMYYEGLIAAFLNEREKAKEQLTKSLTIGNDEILKTNAQKILTAFRDFELSRDAPVEMLQALLAQSFDAVEEHGLAIELAFDALKTKHDYRDVWIVLGHAFLNEQKWFDAEAALEKAIALDANHPAAYFFRGLARRNLQKNIESRSDFEMALKLGFKPVILAKEKLANVFFDVKDFPKAYLLYREIIDTDSSDIERFIRPMALAINHLEKPQEALLMAKKASEAHPDSAMAHNLLGWAALANNDFGPAEKYLDEALKRDPELDAAYLNFGQLRQREGKLSEAAAYYEKAIELSEKLGNESIGKTARMRYNEIKAGGTGKQQTTEEMSAGLKNEPKMEKVPLLIPSLSLL